MSSRGRTSRSRTRVADGGRIVAVSTGGTTSPSAGAGTYLASKAAAEQLAWSRARWPLGVALPKMLMWKRYHESRAFSGHGAMLLAVARLPRNAPGSFITHSAPLSPRTEFHGNEGD